MAINTPFADPRIAACAAELYDVSDDYDNDIRFLRKLIADQPVRRILDPFCGTGRVMLPLLADGHEVHGLDHCPAMMERARVKIDALGGNAPARAGLARLDVVDEPWPGPYDGVFLGANCFWQLGSAAEQEALIAGAADSLRPGGWLYIENDNMEGELADSWCRIDDQPRPWKSPRGTCADGTKVRSLIQTIWFDKPARLWRARRKVTIEDPDGRTCESDWCISQTHPSSALEVEQALTARGFRVLGRYRSTDGEPYEPGCGRAILWARRDS